MRNKLITEKERTNHSLKGEYVVEEMIEKLGHKYYNMTD